MQRRNSRLLSIIIAALVLGTGGALLLQAQIPAMPAMAVVFDDALWFYGLDDAPEQVTATEDSTLLELAWSQDGGTLAYLVGSETLPRLWVTDRENTTQTRLAIDLNTAGLPLGFTAAGEVIYTTVSGEGQVEVSDDGRVYEPVDVFRIAPEREAPPVRLATITLETNCGSGVLLPADMRYYEEAGFGGNGLILAMTRYGLAHSTSCRGEGVALTDPATGETTLLDPTLSRAKLAPDGERLAGISEGRLVVIDLESRMQRLIPTGAMPDQVAWGALGANALYYTTRTATGEQVALTDEQEAAFITNSLFNELPPDLPLYETAIHRVNLDDASDEILFVQDSFAIGRLAALADGSGLIFSRVPNLTAWALDVASGTVSADDPGLLLDALETEVFRLDLSSQQAEQLGRGLSKFTLNPTHPAG